MWGFVVFGRTIRVQRYLWFKDWRRAYPDGETSSGLYGFSTTAPQLLPMYRSCMNSPNETSSLLLTLLEQTKTAYCSTGSNASFIMCEASRSAWHSEAARLAA